jgi:hypothetical protein
VYIFSYLKVTRVSDGAVLLVDGNMNDGSPEQGRREYVMNILSGEVYRIEIVTPPTKPFKPSFLQVQLRDDGVCKGGLTLQVKQDDTKPWSLASSDVIYPQ